MSIIQIEVLRFNAENAGAGLIGDKQAANVPCFSVTIALSRFLGFLGSETRSRIMHSETLLEKSEEETI